MNKHKQGYAVSALIQAVKTTANPSPGNGDCEGGLPMYIVEEQLLLQSFQVAKKTEHNSKAVGL